MTRRTIRTPSRISRSRSSSWLANWILLSKYKFVLLLGIIIGRHSTFLRMEQMFQWGDNSSSVPILDMDVNANANAASQTERSATSKPKSPATTTNLDLLLPPVALGKHDGFHPVYVYRGNSDAIHHLPPNIPSLQKEGKGSQVDQDRVISALFDTYQTKYGAKNSNSDSSSSERKPYFVDLAANDALSLSNTVLLEEKGWDGLCIEPNGVYWYRLAHRKCTIAAAFVGGKEDMQEITVSLTNGVFGGIVGETYDNQRKNSSTDEKRYTVSLNTVLEQFAVPRDIDYVSLDVEGAEELIMKDFPFESYTIKFLTIERPKPSLQTLLKSHGYVLVMKLIYWGDTLWVHEDVIKNGFGLDEIEQVVHSNSRFSKKEPPPGGLVFDIETGEYEKMKQNK